MKQRKEILLSLLAQCVILALCILLINIVFWIFPKTMLLEPVIEDGEESLPWLCRLIYLFLGFVFALVMLFISEKAKEIPAFCTAFAGGIFLWQSVGECAWHFGFSGMEDWEASFYLLLFLMLLAYAYKHNSFGWNFWVFLLSFLVNWLGHFIMIGTYPLAPAGMTTQRWYLISGVVSGTLLLLLPVYTIRKYNSLKANMISAELIFLSFGIYLAAFGLF